MIPFLVPVPLPPPGLEEVGAQTRSGQTSTGYNGRKGPRMATKGGEPPEPRPVYCPKCQRQLGLKGSTPAVRRNGVLMHRECRR